MKNQLIPLSEESCSPGHYQPALVEHSHQAESLTTAMSYRYGSYILRPDLHGMVRECGGLPIVELPHPEMVAAVRDADADLVDRWTASIA